MEFLLMALPALMGLLLGLFGRLPLALILAVSGFIAVMAMGYWQSGRIPGGENAGLGALAMFAGGSSLVTALFGLVGAGLRRMIRRGRGSGRG